MSQPRPDYPRPILRRDQWLNLNGSWRYAPDPNDLGLQQRWHLGHDYPLEIQVPYPVESAASGIHNDKPVLVHWYECNFEVPKDWQ